MLGRTSCSSSGSLSPAASEQWPGLPHSTGRFSGGGGNGGSGGGGGDGGFGGSGLGEGGGREGVGGGGLGHGGLGAGGLGEGGGVDGGEGAGAGKDGGEGCGGNDCGSMHTSATSDVRNSKSSKTSCVYRTLESSPAMASSVSLSTLSPKPHANTLSVTVLRFCAAAMAAAEPPRWSSCLPSERSSTTLVAVSRPPSTSSCARFKPAEMEVLPSGEIASIAASISPSSMDHVTRIVAVSLKDTTEKRAVRPVEFM